MEPLSLSGPDRNLLVVEGADDFHTVPHLFDAFKYKVKGSGTESEYKCRVRGGDSYTEIRDRIYVWLEETGLERFGIIVDADDDAGNRWKSLRSRLVEIGYEAAPQTVDPNGTIVVAAGKPTVGVWIMPDNLSPGALEDFIRQLIPQEDVLWPRAESVVEDIPLDYRLFPDVSVMKAKMHTWLAWQEEPGKPIGQAITKRYLDPAASEARLFKSWLTRLFEL